MMKYNYSPHFRVTAQREIEEICSREVERYFELSKREAGQGGSRGNCPPTVLILTTQTYLKKYEQEQKKQENREKKYRIFMTK